MSYEHTAVPVSRSQEGIRKLILSNGGTDVAFISQPPLEGFEAQVPIEGKLYHIRIVAECVPKERKRRRTWRGGSRSQEDPMEIEAKRVWRVLFFNLKSTFDSANSKVMELRRLLLSYIVTKDGKTVGDHIIPRFSEAITSNPARLLMGECASPHGIGG